MRDYVNAMRAVWDKWQHPTRLDFQSDHYDLDLMVPLFDPGPIENERYRDRVDRIEFSIPVETPDDADRLRAILADLA